MAFSKSTLARVNALQLECDGLTRVISTLLQRDGVDHRVFVGQLEVDGVGTIDYHWWIDLLDGTLCDLRARMWLGEFQDVPHGVFAPSDLQRYLAKEEIEVRSVALIPPLFQVLTGVQLASFPPMQVLPPHRMEDS